MGEEASNSDLWVGSLIEDVTVDDIKDVFGRCEYNCLHARSARGVIRDRMSAAIELLKPTLIH
jgi:hypothetical protein